MNTEEDTSISCVLPIHIQASSLADWVSNLNVVLPNFVNITSFNEFTLTEYSPKKMHNEQRTAAGKRY